MPRRLRDLADALDLSVEGDAQLEITGLAGLEDAGPADLSFVTGPRYAKALAASGAGAVIAPADLDVGERSCLRSLAPYADFSRAIDLFAPPAPRPTGVHPTAVLGADVKLGADVAIGAYAVIGPGARIGDRTCIHPHVTVYAGVEVGADCEIHSGAHLREGVRLGDRVVVQNGAVVGSDGFGFTFDGTGRRLPIPHTEGVHVGDDVSIGANTTIDSSHVGQARHGHPTAATRIDAGAKIDNLVQIGHGSSVGERTVLCAQVGLSGSTVVGRNALFAGKAASAGHLHIGDGAMLGGMAAAAEDVEPGAQRMGIPAIDRRLWARIHAASKRLPDLLHRVRRIEKHLGLGDR